MIKANQTYRGRYEMGVFQMSRMMLQYGRSVRSPSWTCTTTSRSRGSISPPTSSREATFSRKTLWSAGRQVRPWQTLSWCSFSCPGVPFSPRKEIDPWKDVNNLTTITRVRTKPSDPAIWFYLCSFSLPSLVASELTMVVGKSTASFNSLYLSPFTSKYFQ